MATANWNASRKDRLLIQTADGFQDSTAAAGLDISTICWSVASADFDNDGTIDSSVQNPSYTYNRPGIYTVKLIVTDMDGSIYTSIREDYIKLQTAE